jgi:hypothetical protein
LDSSLLLLFFDDIPVTLGYHKHIHVSASLTVGFQIGKIVTLFKAQKTPLLGWFHADFPPVLAIFQKSCHNAIFQTAINGTNPWLWSISYIKPLWRDKILQAIWLPELSLFACLI